jgi:hypothetical protein
MTSGSPAPDSTASVIASRASRSIPAGVLGAGVDMAEFYGPVWIRSQNHTMAPPPSTPRPTNAAST